MKTTKRQHRQKIRGFYTEPGPMTPLSPRDFAIAKAIRQILAKYGSMNAAMKHMKEERERMDREEAERQIAELNAIWPGTKPTPK